MAEIIPAIIGQNFAEIKNKFEQIEGRTNWIHLDVMDGTFTTGTSWRAPDDLADLNSRTKIEIHLMIRQPEESIRAWADVADRIMVQVESTERLSEIIGFFTGLVVEVGLVLNLLTPLEVLENISGKIDLIQLMAIAEIGEHGHPFDERVLGKIKDLRARYPGVIIQVDGGVNLDNAPRLLAAGADNLVVGSAVWRTPNPIATLRLFQNLQS